ncbi:MAG TPA: bifunctional demethylmenaquinone methyltransferase/2-methoxy-6-polyprenyl-1,4-benzoquinol methylase UbiE [Bacteroidales bacterium]|nr:bifunctional demethylmenaquinone methyltransferase/2-methoxy-6-polyprenyl-1,4-benzoquinol methylase UbiE [Bacteroidales bacterium]
MKTDKITLPEMFDNIADNYDRLNHRLSFGLDKKWRRKFVNHLSGKEYKTIVDIACGTGDVLIELQKLNAEKYYAIDPAEKMLAYAKQKCPNSEFVISGAEEIPLADNSVDLITVVFGIRNFEDLSKSIKEFYRILNSGGNVSIMEFSLPDFFLFRWGFLLYLKLLVPLSGRLSKEQKNAYKYLSASIVDFARKTNVAVVLEKSGFIKTKIHKLMLGSVVIYTFYKE